MIPESLRKEVVEAFHAYEKIVVEHLLQRPGWRLDAAPLKRVLDTKNPEAIRSFIQDLRRQGDDFLNGTIVRTDPM